MAKSCFSSIRVFASNLGYLLLVDIFAVIFFKSSLTTIERRFQLSTTSIALITSGYQIGNLLLMIFVSYYGSRWHRPRAIALGSALVVTGYVIISIPQFAGDRYQYADAGNNQTSSSLIQVDTCQSNNNNSTVPNTCDDESQAAPTNNWYIVILLGNVLCGIGATPLQPLGISYIDDFSHPRNTPMYIGIVMTIALIGPPLGFLFGAFILNIWVDFLRSDVDAVTITPQDPNWVGAWWLGFLISAALILSASISLFFFPKKMNKEDDTPTKDKTQGPKTNLKKSRTLGDKKDSFSSDDSLASGIVATFKRTVTSPPYMLMVLVALCGNFSILGVISFFPKYLEVQFGVSASQANMYYGATSISCLMVGTLVGSFIMKLRNPGLLGMSKMILFSHFFGFAFSIPIILLKCDTTSVAGITVPYGSSSDSKVLPVDVCNSQCGCIDGSFAPVCGSDGITYLTPCHAGCQGIYSYDQKRIQNYTDCLCVSSDEGSLNWSQPGRCESTKCQNLIFLVLGFKAISTLLAGIGATPSYVLLIRTVHQKDKAFAIGLSILIIRILGQMPAPLMFGKAIDSTCLYWESSACSSKGYCRVKLNNLDWISNFCLACHSIYLP